MEASTGKLVVPYEPRGASLDLLGCRDDEVLLDGPAGTGKSTGVLHKLYYAGFKYRQARFLMVRETRASLSEAGIKTFEEEVVTPGDGIRWHDKKQSFLWPNGTSLRVGGLDDTTKIFSAQYDIIYWQEAIEGKESAWEDLTTRLRNGRMPYAQLIGDTNPGYWTHWLNQRCLKNQTTRLVSRHADNPRFWNYVCLVCSEPEWKHDEFTNHKFKRSDEMTWTPEGAKYMSRLQNLTGLRRARMYEGKWVTAEGIIYPEFDPLIHRCDKFPIPATWETYWSIDFGYTNPFVWQAWAIDDDGRAFRFKEIYRTKRTVLEHCAQIKSLNLPRPRAVICDHDAEDRATFEKVMGMKTLAAFKDVSPGIQNVRDRLIKAGDGKPRVFWMKDSLVEVDPDLRTLLQPTCSEEEFEVYVWDQRNKLSAKEVPLKQHDHGKDSERYFLAYLDKIRSGGKPGMRNV